MRITLCDDEPNQLSTIKGYIDQYIKKSDRNLEAVVFSDPKELLSFEEQKGGSEIYLLDIVMEELSGLELGRKIREYNKRAAIIFLTSAKDYSLEAFSVHAFSYLLKPIDKDKLFDELDKCIRYYVPPQKEEIKITVRTAEGVMPLGISKINAVEYFDHRLVFHLTAGERIEGVYQKSPFDIQVKELLPFDSFIKCSNSYFVNRENIALANARSFKMKNGEEYPITRKYSDAKIKFLNGKFK